MTELTFYLVDVFAETRYAGNQLAVFRNAAGLSTAEMQAIAREINFSETTFILSDTPHAGGFDVRIFTPREEVPFAGHPTLGTAHILRTEVLDDSAECLTLNLKAGAIPVTFTPEGYGWMQQLPPAFGPRYPVQDFAPLLGLEPADFDARFPIQEVSTGLPFFIVPLTSLAALQKARVNRERYFAFIQHTEAKGILIFCPETRAPQNQLSVRVFVDYYGVPEDPATGSANGCLAGYLVQHSYWGQEAIAIRCEQGYEIGRPSLLLLEAARDGATIRVRVGGRSITVARGVFL